MPEPTPIAVPSTPSIPIPTGLPSSSYVGSFHHRHPHGHSPGTSRKSGFETLGIATSPAYRTHDVEPAKEDDEHWRPPPFNRILSASDWLGHGTTAPSASQSRSPEPINDPWARPGPSANPSNGIPGHITSHPLFSYHAHSTANSYTSSPPAQLGPNRYLSTSAPSEIEDLPGPSSSIPQNHVAGGPDTLWSPVSEGHINFWATRLQGLHEQPSFSGGVRTDPNSETLETLHETRESQESTPSKMGPTLEEMALSPASAFLSNFSSPTLSAVGTGLRRGGSIKEAGWGGRIGESSLGQKARQLSFGTAHGRNPSVSPQDRFSRAGPSTGSPAGLPPRISPGLHGGPIGGGNGFPGRSISPYRSFSLSQSTALMAAEEMSSTMSTTSSAPDGKGAKVLQYTLGKIIGRGGFSTVRLATHDETGEEFACRIIKRDDLSDTSGSLENFELELELWKSLPRHPRILPLLDMYRDPDGYATYLISPFMAGGSLLDVVKRDGGSEETAKRWFPGVVAAVQALHEGYAGFEEGGMLHGDLKLDNFLVGRDGSICVCDFGLAQKLDLKANPDGGAVDEERGRGRSEGKRVIIESRPASRDRSALGNSRSSRSRSRYRPMGGSTLAPYDEGRLDEFSHLHTNHQRHNTESVFPEGGSRGGHRRNPSPSPGRRWFDMLPGTRAFPSASLPYAPPEILSAPPSGPSLAQDMWALGIILHALLTSRLPFVDTFDPRLQMKILRGDWVVPTHLGAEWLDCLMGCLDGDKNKRWTIKQLAQSDALQGWKRVKSRSRSRSRAPSVGSGRRDEARLSISPQNEMHGFNRGRGNRMPSRDRSVTRELRPPSTDRSNSNATSRNHSRAPSVPRQQRPFFGTPPQSSLGVGLSSVTETGDALSREVGKLALNGQPSRSRSRGRGSTGNDVERK
jgi:serine/threonine protein kinase